MIAGQSSHLRRRRAIDRAMTGVMIAAAVTAVTPLVLIVFHVLTHGIGALSLDLFTEDPMSPGRPGGGVRNALVGSAIMVGLGIAIGAPIAIGCGIFLAEYGRNRAGMVMRFLVDVLAGMPSITVGLFVYGLIVLPNRHFMALAGAISLAIILVPIVARVTEEMMLLVPRSLREASYALGASRWRTVLYNGARHCIDRPSGVPCRSRWRAIPPGPPDVANESAVQMSAPTSTTVTVRRPTLVIDMARILLRR